MSVECCGHKLSVKVCDVPAKEQSGPCSPARKSQQAFWFECPSCRKRSSYSYDTAEEAEAAWHGGWIGRAAK